MDSGTRQLVSAAGTLPTGPLPAALLDPALRAHDASSGHATDSELIEVLKMWQEEVDFGYRDLMIKLYIKNFLVGS